MQPLLAKPTLGTYIEPWGWLVPPSSLPQLPIWVTEKEALSLSMTQAGEWRGPQSLILTLWVPTLCWGAGGRALQSQKRLEPEVTEVGGAGSPLSALVPSGPYPAHPRGS